MVRVKWLRRFERFVLLGSLFLLLVPAMDGGLRAQTAQVSSNVPSAGGSVPPLPFVFAHAVSLGYAPTGIASGHLTARGNLDLVTTDYESGTITVFAGEGNGSFAAGLSTPAGANPSSVTIADINGDGKADVILANESEGAISVFSGNGDGTLGARKTYSIGFNPYFVAVGDFSGKGNADVVVAARAGTTLAFLQNDGAGNFAKPVNRALSQISVGLVAADFNHDGHLDLAIANADGSVSILLGKGNGQFSSLPPVSVSPGALSSITAADFNRDGNIDLAVTSSAGNQAAILIGNGDGTFTPAALVTVGNSPVASYVADVDGDGIPDLVVVNKGSNTFSVLSGNGDGTFKPALHFVVGNAPLGLAAGDFYGNSRVDLATIDNLSKSLSVPQANGDGTFVASRAYSAGVQPVAVASGDLAGNGQRDLAVGSYCANDATCGGTGSAAVLLADGAGVYRIASTYAMGAGSVSLALIDVNGDQKLDLVSVNRVDKTLSVRLGAGDGTFGKLITIPLSEAPLAVAAADFNKDGNADLAVLEDCGSPKCSQPGQVEVLLGSGDGNFKSASTNAVGVSPAGLTVGATFAGGAKDILVVNTCGQDASCKSGGTASVLLGDGTGAFKPGTDIALGNSPTSIALANLRGAGVLDLVVSRSSDNAIAVLPGTGAGTFGTAVPYAVGNAPGALVVTDFNGDGKPDVAVANTGDATVSVLFGSGDGTLQTAFALPVAGNPSVLTSIEAVGGHASLATANGSAVSPTTASSVTVVPNIVAIPALGTNLPIVTLASAPNPSQVNQAVTLTATVSGSAGIPTGTVTFSNGSTAIPDCSPSPNPVTLNGTGAATCTTSSLTASGSPNSLTAVYSGDPVTYNTATSNTVTQTVTALASTVAVTPTTASPSPLNTNVTFLASLSPSPTPVAPSGTITFSLNATPIPIIGCGGPVTTAGTATCAIQNMPAGVNSVTAAYSGDLNYSVASPGSASYTTTKLSPTISLTPAPSPAGPSALNTSVTFTATLAGVAFTPIAPGGTVTFLSNGTAVSDCAPGAVNASQQATCTTATLVAGVDSITATYSGDANFSTATTATALPYTVTKLSPTISLTPSPASPSAVNTSVTFTATLAGVAFTPVAPGGTVSFSANGTSITGCTTAAVNASQQATCTTATLVAGVDSITATYSGDTNFSTATTASGLPYTITKLSPTISLTPAPSPASPSALNTSVTLTATITGVAFTPVAPGGTVSFSANGTAITGCTAATLNASQQATCTTASLPAGANSITATYSGDANFNTASAAALPYTVTQLSPTIGVTPTPASPATFNTSVTFTATLAAVAFTPVAPGGTVSFSANGTAIAGCTTAAVNASQQATCTTVSLKAGANSITAVYSGDANFSTATSASVPYSITQASTTVTVSSPTAPTPTVNTSVNIVANLGGTSSSNPPGGTVAFFDNGSGTAIATCASVAVLAVPPANTSYAATCTTSALTGGSNQITAVYTGDSNYQGSNSSASPVNYPVNKEAATVTLSGPSTASSVNSLVTLTAILSGTFTPTVPATSGTNPSSISFFANASSTAIAGCSALPVALLPPPNSTSYGATCATNSFVVPADQVTATYTGDANFTASNQGSATVLISPAVPIVSLSVTPTAASINQPVSIVATVAPSGSAPSVFPKGTVSFFLGATAICNGPVALTTGTQTPTATCTYFSPSPIASTTVSAVYNPDSNFTAGNSPTSSLSVSKATTSTQLTSAGSTVINQAVTLSTTIAPANSGTIKPSGTVTYTTNYSGTPGGTCPAGVTVLGDGTVPACTFIFGLAGTYTIQASYPGDANFANSTSNQINQQVTAQAQGIIIGSTIPSSIVNQPVNLTASFNPPITSSTVPGGTITYSDNFMSTSTVLCNKLLVTSISLPSCPVAFSTAGTHSITASYSGDANFSAAGSAPFAQAVTADATAIVISSASFTSSVSQPVMFVATVTPSVAGATAIPGSVTFTSTPGGGTTSVICSNVAVTSTTGPAENAAANCPFTFAATGAYTINANFTGDGNFSNSAALAVTQTVVSPTPAVAVSLMPATTPVTVNQTIPFTVTITPPQTGTTPTGKLTFTDSVPATFFCSAAPIAVTSAGGGTAQASCTATILSAGTHTITAHYSGDSNFTTAAGSAALTATASSTTLNLTSSLPASFASQTVMFKAVVTPTPHGANLQAPAGVVTFKSTDPTGLVTIACPNPVPLTPVGDGTSSAPCSASFPHAAAPPGQFSVIATYSDTADQNFTASTFTVTQTVQDFNVAVSITPSGTGDISSSAGVYVSQGNSTSSDPFGAAQITVNLSTSAMYNPSLSVACSVTAVDPPNTTSSPVTVPSCSVASQTVQVGNNVGAGNSVINASSSATPGVFAVQFTVSDPNFPSATQTASFKLYVVAPSTALSLASGASGTQNVTFNTATAPTNSSLSSFSCPYIVQTSGGQTQILDNTKKNLLTCAGTSTGVVGVATQVPVTINTEQSASAQLFRGSSVAYGVAVFGMPFLGLLALVGSRKSSRKGIFRLICFALVALGISLAAGGCGGSFTAPKVPVITGIPAGNYLVEVVAQDSSGNSYYAVVPLDVISN
jgi:hypothetical protein